MGGSFQDGLIPGEAGSRIYGTSFKRIITLLTCSCPVITADSIFATANHTFELNGFS